MYNVNVFTLDPIKNRVEKKTITMTAQLKPQRSLTLQQLKLEIGTRKSIQISDGKSLVVCSVVDCLLLIES
jgi:hypothetical protein